MSQLARSGPAQVAQRQRLQGLFGPAIQFREASPEDSLGPGAEPVVAQRQGEADPPTVPSQAEAPPKANATGLPDALKSGVEQLSGLSLDGVKVHYNSAQPAQLNALAYAQGTDIHLGPGQEQHLAHEAWHVVQQAQGRVRPTLQMRGGAPVNDDAGLEREADVMGARALSVGRSGEPAQLMSLGVGPGVVQLARGGIEYTEGGTTSLTSYPGGGAPAGTNAVGTQLLGATTVGAYRVPAANMGAWAGAARNNDFEVFRNNRLKLTNDVQSAEWVIEGHAAAGVSGRQLTQQVMRDVASMFGFRQTLAAFVAAQAMAGHETVLMPGGGDLNVPDAKGLFVYRPAAASAGKVQITAQYANVDTIRRINELNASKYLTGTKVADGRDTARVAGDRNMFEKYADWKQTTSSVTAASLFADLLGLSVALAAGGANLTAAQVALIKLMVVNDAMASNMVRHAALLGQAEEKNIQRFFPKAQRQTYVEAVAQGAVPAPMMAALRADIAADQAAMAQAVWNHADPFALGVDHAIKELTTVAANAAIASPATAVAAGLAAPLIAAPLVAQAITAVGADIAELLARGIPVNQLVPVAAGEVSLATGVADPDATAIVRAIVLAVQNARDVVTLAVAPSMAARRDNDAGRATTAADRTAIKDLVLGANGALLEAWIGRAALAYTDATGAATDHVDAATNTGNVISSTLGYTPVAGGVGQGAVYEFREREIDIAEGDTGGLETALTNLFGAAD